MLLQRFGRDRVCVREDGSVCLRTRSGEVVDKRVLLSELDKPIVEVKGWVELCLRERGKKVPGSSRDGFNIWTNTGREYLALHQSYQDATHRYRDDAVAYIGVGTGAQIEDVSVSMLVIPHVYAPGLYLAALDVPPTFPLSPTRTTVRYHRVFQESEITTVPGGPTVLVSELGLFTDGYPTATPPYAPFSMASYLDIGTNAPVSYKTFEPVGKTDALQLEVSWEVRF
jgi:hypothetical protein